MTTPIETIFAILASIVAIFLVYKGFKAAFKTKKVITNSKPSGGGGGGHQLEEEIREEK